MDPQQKVVALALLAVANRKPMPPQLAMAIPALDQPHKNILATRLAQLHMADATIVSLMNPALQSLKAVGDKKLKSGKTVAKTMAALPPEQRPALMESAAANGLSMSSPQPQATRLSTPSSGPLPASSALPPPPSEKRKKPRLLHPNPDQVALRQTEKQLRKGNFPRL